MRARVVGHPACGPQNQLLPASGVGSAGESHSQNPPAYSHRTSVEQLALGVMAESACGHAAGFTPASQFRSSPKSTAPPHVPSAQVRTLPQPYSQSISSSLHAEPCAGATAGQTGLQAEVLDAASLPASDDPPSTAVCPSHAARSAVDAQIQMFTRAMTSITSHASAIRMPPNHREKPPIRCVTVCPPQRKRDPRIHTGPRFSCWRRRP